MLVVEANRKPVSSARELAAVIRSTASGGTLLLRVMVPNGTTRQPARPQGAVRRAAEALIEHQLRGTGR